MNRLNNFVAAFVMTVCFSSCSNSVSRLESDILEQANERLDGTFVYATHVELNRSDDSSLFTGTLTLEINGEEREVPIEVIREGDSLHFDIPDFD